MGKLKVLFQQVFMISTGILFVIGINGVISHLTGAEFDFPWYYPFSIIFMGFLCALPTFLFIINDWGKQRHFLLNLVLHCLSIWGLTAAVGWIFNWYSTWGQFLCVTIEYIGIYVFIWVVSLWFRAVEDKEINKALTDIRDEE